MVIPSLPWELECEILSRVPPTSVKRLQLTCKRWYALFKDQRFINNHLRKSETQMVLLNDESVYSFSFNFHGINNWYGRFIDCTGKLKSLKYSEKVKVSEIFHCEGLLLCTTTDNSLVVWNPCTGQTRWIQSRQSSNRYTKYKYFLGYENENKSRDSLKILELSYNLGVWKFEIYEFNSDSWRVLDTDSVNFGILSSLGVSLKGNTYWLVYDLVSFILRFDFTTERFGHLSLPRQSDDDYDAGVVLSVVREEKLALLFQNSARSSQVKIWVTNTKADETKYFSWSEFSFSTVCLTRVMSFLVDEENKWVLLCHQDYIDQERTIISVAGENIYGTVVYKDCKETHYDRSRQRPSSLLLSYVPSLVQIPAKQSTPGGKRKS